MFGLFPVGRKFGACTLIIGLGSYEALVLLVLFVSLAVAVAPAKLGSNVLPLVKFSALNEPAACTGTVAG